jgi:Flp pilus assembly protein TadG
MGRTDQSQRGAAAVEFAILAPLFIAALFALVEFGMILYAKSMLANATREGARYGIVYCTPRRSAADIQAVVQGYLNQCGLTDSATVDFPKGVGGASGSPLDVRVNYTYRFFIVPQIMNRFMGGSLPTTLNLTTVTEMLME